MVEGKPGEKITFLSRQQVKTYRIWLAILAALVFMVTAGSVYGMFFFRMTGVFLIGPLLLYKLLRLYKGIKVVEFDEEYFYVTEKGYEIIVPLENLKTIEIKNLGGIYRVTFFDRIQSGLEIYFMPSLIYPLDFKKQDAKVNRLRSLAWNARQLKHPWPKNALQS